MFLNIKECGSHTGVLASISPEIFIHHFSINSAFFPEGSHNCLLPTKDTSKKTERTVTRRFRLLAQRKLWLLPEGQCLANGNPLFLNSITWDIVSLD